MTPTLIIYRENLLPYSETFILSQAESLRGYTPHYVGTRRVEGITTPPERTLVLNDRSPLGRAEELLYKATGRSPRLGRYLRALRPALIHAHFGADGVMALPLARRWRLPLAVTFHGYDATTHDAHLLASDALRNRELVRRRPQLIASGALIIAVSEHIRRALLARGFPAGQVVTHHTGIDTARFAPDPVDAREAEPSVLFVGRFVEKKGCAYLLRAMAAVAQALPAARLVLIGGGPLRSELEATARALGLRADFLGSQSGGAVREWMRRAWVLCLPSVTAANGDTEGLPTVVLEAMASGLPVVTTDGAGNPEAVTDGETGCLVPERDEGALARALTRLLGDEDLRRNFGQRAREVVLARFDLQRQAGALERLYARVALPRLDGRASAGQRAAAEAEGVGGA